MPDHAYSQHDHGYAASWKRIHGNSEETHVFIMEQSDDYLTLAMDIDPRDWSPVAAEAFGYEPTLEGAVKRAETWMREHPKGIAASSGGGGIGEKINSFFLTMMKKLDDYGNQQVQEVQKQQ